MLKLKLQYFGHLMQRTDSFEKMLAAAAAKSLQLYPTLCNSIDGSPTGSPIPGTLQARTLEWVAIKACWEWSNRRWQELTLTF